MLDSIENQEGLAWKSEIRQKPFWFSTIPAEMSWLERLSSWTRVPFTPTLARSFAPPLRAPVPCGHWAALRCAWVGAAGVPAVRVDLRARLPARVCGRGRVGAPDTAARARYRAPLCAPRGTRE